VEAIKQRQSDEQKFFDDDRKVSNIGWLDRMGT
jgi:hypothetical protein